MTAPPLGETRWSLPLLLQLLLLVLPRDARLACGDIALAVQRTTTTTLAPAGLDVTAFPFQATLEQVHGPSPLFPFVVEGSFRTGSSGGGIRAVFTMMDGAEMGIQLKMIDRRLYFSVAAAHGTWTSRSQQAALDDDRDHRFLAVATAERVQVSVDGLLGTSAAIAASGCEPANKDLCFFGWQTSPSSWVVIGGEMNLDLSTAFEGEIRDIKMRRMAIGEEPMATAADAMSGSASAPTPSSGNSSDGTDAFFTVLIVILIIVGVSLAASGTMLGCWLMRDKDASTAKASSVHPAAGPAPSPVASSPGPTSPAPAAIPPIAVGQVASSTTRAKEINVRPFGSVFAEDKLEDLSAVPPWWTTVKIISSHSSDLVPASMATRTAVQELMNSTWRSVVTRDRAKHQANKEVQHFEVVQVNRNENPKLWQQYVLRRRSIAKRIGEEDLLNSVLTEGASTSDLGSTEPGCNEFLLFHGTKPSAVSSIIENDFLLRLAGSHRGTLYGHGCYFAESSSKADEYASDDKEGIYRGLYAMLLCRVTLGRALYTDEASPDGARLKGSCSGPNARYHSVLGDREKARGTYREFIVYDVAQAYPEYVVIYRRIETE